MSRDPLDYLHMLAGSSPEELLRHLARPEPAVPAWRTGREPRVYQTGPAIRAPLAIEQRQRKRFKSQAWRRRRAQPEQPRKRVLRALEDLRLLLTEAEDENAR